MAGYRESFGSNVDFAYQRGVTDVAQQLERNISTISQNSRGLAQMVGQASQARRSIKELKGEMSDLRDSIANATDPKVISRLTAEFERARKSAENFQKKLKQMPFTAAERGFGKLTKGLLSLNTSILTIGFDFLITSIKRVYELQERWTRAIGGFNMRIGGMTAGLRGAQRAATAWSSTVRGLTNGDINEGIQLFGDFTDAIGRTVERGDEFERFGLQLARGFNIGGQGAGQLTKVFENLGNSGGSAAETIKAMVAGANEAHVPTNLLAKDILESSVYMARFGKEGQHTFVTGAAWVRKYTISMEQLRNAVEGMDMFDQAAMTASKLNTAFGTMINSMDLMMEDDPAKRLEMIRQQFLAQGTTFDKLTPKQRRYLSETLKLTDDQTAALLNATKAGESYSDFQEAASKREREEVSAKKLMEGQLRATAQTMYAFGAAFDRVTVAIAKAIKPLLVVFGLAKSGDRDFKSFGSRMESITVTVEKFFDTLAANEQWNLFMVELAQDLKKAGSALKEFVVSGRAADLVGEIASGMKSFYTTVRDIAKTAAPALRPLISIFVTLSKHLKEIAILWGTFKGVNAVRSGFSGLAGQIGGAASIPGGTKTSVRGGRGAMGVGMGLAAAEMMGGGAGASAGGAIGGMIGAFIPFIGPLMGPLGAALGKGIEGLFKGKSKSDLEKAMEDLASVTKDVSAAQNQLDALRNRREARAMAQAEQNKQADKVLLQLKDKKVKLDDAEMALAGNRLKQLANFGVSQAMVKRGLDEMQKGPLSKDVLAAISSAQNQYRSTTEALDVATKKILENEETKAKLAALEMQKRDAQASMATIDQEILEIEKQKKDELQNIEKTKAGRSTGQSVMSGLYGVGFAAAYEKTSQKQLAIDAANFKYSQMIEKKKTERADIEIQLGRSSLDVLNEQADLERKALILAYQAKQSEEARAMGINDFSKQFRDNIIKDVGITGAQLDYAITGRPKTKLADGGIVTRATNALIGENGPEAVVPLRNFNYATGGSSTSPNTSSNTPIIIEVDGQRLARALVKNVVTGRN